MVCHINHFLLAIDSRNLQKQSTDTLRLKHLHLTTKVFAVRSRYLHLTFLKEIQVFYNLFSFLSNSTKGVAKSQTEL